MEAPDPGTTLSLPLTLVLICFTLAFRLHETDGPEGLFHVRLLGEFKDCLEITTGVRNHFPIAEQCRATLTPVRPYRIASA